MNQSRSTSTEKLLKLKNVGVLVTLKIANCEQNIAIVQ